MTSAVFVISAVDEQSDIAACAYRQPSVRVVSWENQRKQPSTSLHCLAEHGRQQRVGAERAAVRRAAGQAQRPAASLSCARLWLGNMGCLVGEQIDEQVNVKVLAKECGLPGNRGCGATADRRAVWRRLGAAGVAAQLSQVRGEPAGGWRRRAWTD